jgi:hypothetical protein
MSSESAFKKCPGCFTIWDSRDDFLADSSLELNGYKADFQEIQYGLFFTHKVDNCFSTMAIEVKDFADMYSGNIYRARKTLSEERPRDCTDEKHTSPYPLSLQGQGKITTLSEVRDLVMYPYLSGTSCA